MCLITVGMRLIIAEICLIIAEMCLVIAEIFRETLCFQHRNTLFLAQKHSVSKKDVGVEHVV